MRNNSIKMSLYSRAARGYKVTQHMRWVVYVSVLIRDYDTENITAKESQHRLAKEL